MLAHETHNCVHLLQIVTIMAVNTEIPYIQNTIMMLLVMDALKSFIAFTIGSTDDEIVTNTMENALDEFCSTPGLKEEILPRVTELYQIQTDALPHRKILEHVWDAIMQPTREPSGISDIVNQINEHVHTSLGIPEPEGDTCE